MKSVSTLGVARTALSVAVLSALVACGGGGGSSHDDPTVTLSGVAAKGLLKSAVVKAYRVNADGTQTLLKESVTDTDGSYSLADIPAGVTVLVEISAGPNTTMVDEATNATNVPVPSGFKIRAATTTVEGGTNTLQVTPFSEMAVAKAIAADANGKLTPTNVEGANADIRIYLGFDVLANKPEFNTDGTAPKNKAALMLAAVSQLASDDTEVDNLGCDNTAAAGDRIKCVIDKMAERGSDDSTLATKIEAAKETVLSDDFEGTDDDVPPPPLPQPGTIVAPSERATAITDAKALIASIRANAPYMGGSAGADTLDKRLRSVKDIISNAASPVGDSSLELYKAVVRATKMLHNGEYQAGPFEVSVDSAMWGYCTFFTTPTGSTAAANADESQSIGCRITYKVYQKNGSGAYYSHQHMLRVSVPSADGEPYVVRSFTVEQKLNNDYTSDTSSASNTVYYSGANGAPNVGYVALTSNQAGDITTFSMTGDYAAGVRAAVQGYVAKNTVNATVAPATVSVEGVDMTRLNITGTFATSGGSKPAGSVQLASGSYLQTKFTEAGNVNSTEDGISGRALKLILSGGAGEASITGTLEAKGFTASQDLQVKPTYLSFQGVVKQSSSVTLFDGKVTAQVTGFDQFTVNDPQSADNTLLGSVAFEGTLYVPTRDAMVVHLTLGTSTYQHYTLSGSYAQGGTTVLVDGSGQESNNDGANITFTNAASGISFKLEPNTTVAYLKKGDVVIGQLTQRTSRVDYADGSYERF